MVGYSLKKKPQPSNFKYYCFPKLTLVDFNLDLGSLPGNTRRSPLPENTVESCTVSWHYNEIAAS